MWRVHTDAIRNTDKMSPACMCNCQLIHDLFKWNKTFHKNCSCVSISAHHGGLVLSLCKTKCAQCRRYFAEGF